MYPSTGSPSSRKRAAPGASPVVPMTIPMSMPMPAMQQQQQQQHQAYNTPQPDQMMRWNGGPVDGSAFASAAAQNMNPYNMASPAGQFAQGIPSPAPTSTVLARRGMSRALVPTVTRPTPFESSPEPWTTFGDEGFHQLQAAQHGQQPTGGVVDDNDSIEALEERAQRAKKEAMNKRKQIPPFVQKLSSFLDESKNTDLIRWSDSGDSFIVIDEDEFAKKLIPELFKHNNYASFVRQLNMYGFHKRVGLSDNSMKASERKNKSPSEYYNPYFKRGHPNLLWLINKPKSGNKANNSGGSGGKKQSANATGGVGKKEEGDGDSEEDGLVDDAFLQPNYAAAATNSQVGSRTAAPVELGPVPKRELVQVKSQLDKLQQQQLAISQLIERLRRDHNTLMQQAIVFQSMHDRHENSINAILNFLANVFRKSLEEQGGVQSVSELLASIIPGGPGHQMAQGSVVDLSDFVPVHQQRTQQRTQDAPNVSPPKRAQRLLPPIPVHGKTTTPASSSSSSVSPAPQGQAPPFQVPSLPQMGSVTELFEGSSSEPVTPLPSHIKDELQAHPHEGMMRIINDTNATTNATGTSPTLDLPDMAAKTAATMSHEQRNKMLHIMAGNASQPPTPDQLPLPRQSQPHPQSQPQQPPLSNAGGRMSTNSLSPVLSSMPPPPYYAMQNTQAEIDALEQMQADQAAKISELSSFLGPLSPLRTIPDMDEAGPSNGYFDENVDMDQYLDSVAFNNDLNSSYNNLGGSMAGNTDGNDFNFDLGNGDGGVGLGTGTGAGGDFLPVDGPFDSGRVMNDGSGNNTPSPAGTEEILRHDLDSPDPKRRRMQ